LSCWRVLGEPHCKEQHEPCQWFATRMARADGGWCPEVSTRLPLDVQHGAAGGDQGLLGDRLGCSIRTAGGEQWQQKSRADDPCQRPKPCMHAGSIPVISRLQPTLAGRCCMRSQE